MKPPATPPPAPPDDAPIEGFSRCHEGILNQLQRFAELPALVEAARRAREVAAGTLTFFHEVVLEHHQEEERALFPAVLESSAEGTERERVQALVERLTREHRLVEQAFRRLEGALKDATKGHDAALAADEVATLVAAYENHARFEEREFLPLSETILSRNSNHMAALSLTLHLRHSVPEVLARFGARI